MNIKSILNRLVQNHRDAATLSVYEARALTDFHEACHGDFAYLPEQGYKSTKAITETGSQNAGTWRVALAQ
ncbi:MAG: hypothetical protein LUH53_06385 [Lachnospiraceae bacterium]|nr:hypothetical protein [Lachnospiraceae bacterium]